MRVRPEKGLNPTPLRSVVWKYFEIDANDKCKALCKLCSRSVSRGGKNASSFGTSNLLAHLKSHHIERGVGLYDKIKKNNGTNNDKKCKNWNTKSA